MLVLGFKKGFTLVELSLSIAFIAILSITIVLIINNAISTYRRGLTLNQVNTVGMDLVDDIRVAVQNSPANLFGSCIDENDTDEMKCINVIKTANVKVNGQQLENVPVKGAFCTGLYSYAWNSGYFFATDAELDSDGMITLRGERIRLLKVEDKNRSVCAAISDGDDALEIDDGTEVEMLLVNDSANNMVLYDFSVAMPAIDSANSSAFYSISFILGTVQGGINVMSSGNFCKPPKDNNSNFDYCAINKFNFAAQANGRRK